MIGELFNNEALVEGVMTFVIALLTLLSTILGIGVKRLKALKNITENTNDLSKSTNEQVNNDHSTNLRDDLTETKNAIEKIENTVNEIKDYLNEYVKHQRSEFRRISHSFGELHDQVERESIDRQSLETRVLSENTRMWNAIDEASSSKK